MTQNMRCTCSVDVPGGTGSETFYFDGSGDPVGRAMSFSDHMEAVQITSTRTMNS